MRTTRFRQQTLLGQNRRSGAEPKVFKRKVKRNQPASSASSIKSTQSSHEKRAKKEEPNEDQGIDFDASYINHPDPLQLQDERGSPQDANDVAMQDEHQQAEEKPIPADNVEVAPEQPDVKPAEDPQPGSSGQQRPRMKLYSEVLFSSQGWSIPKRKK